MITQPGTAILSNGTKIDFNGLHASYIASREREENDIARSLLSHSITTLTGTVSRDALATLTGALDAFDTAQAARTAR
jgi:hypothetical protein